MTVLIELIYLGHLNEILRKGNFPINTKNFKTDPDHAAAEVALKWINRIRIDEHCSKIIRVKYNNIDITDAVIDLDHIPD